MIPEMHLKQPGFSWCACGSFTTSKERIERFLQKGNADYTCKDDFDKACFQHKAYGKYKDLDKRTQSDKFLRYKPFEIASNPK